MQVLGSYFPKLVFSNPDYHDFSYKTSIAKFMKETGYYHIQSTKPDTVGNIAMNRLFLKINILGVSLNDSPIGLLAYILEKFSGWTNGEFVSMNDGGLERSDVF